MFAKDYRKLAWDRLSGNWGTVILAYFVYTVILSLLSYTGVGTIILGGPLLFGMTAVILTLLRTGTTKLDLLFNGISENFVTKMVAYILQYIFIFLWTLLFVIPGLVKTYSYAMTFYILHDNPEMSGQEAITRSRQMMNGHKWQLFCLDFSFIGWILLSMLTCGLLLFWVMPYMQTARAAFYESLKGEDAPIETTATDATESI